MFTFPVVIFLLVCHQSLTVLAGPGVQVATFNCDPDNSKDGINQNVTFPDGFTTIDFNLLSSNVTQDMACNWTFPGNMESYFLLNRLTLAPQELFALLGIADNGTETEIFKGTNVSNAGFIDVKVYKNLKLSIQLKKDDKFPRSFNAQYATKGPTILTPENGILTLILNQANSSFNSNFTLTPPYADQTVFLLSFLTLPKTYKIVVNDHTYTNQDPLPTHFMTKTPKVTMNLVDYNPFNNSINVRFRAVTKFCSGEMELKDDGKDNLIPYVNDAVRENEKLTDAKCVQLLKSVPGSQILVNIPENSSSLLYPDDSLTFYDADGKLELSLNEPAIMYFRNADTFLMRNEYLVVYKSPSFNGSSNKNFIMPTLKVVPNSGCLMVEADKPVEKSIGNGKDLNDVHTIYNMAHFNPGGKVGGIMLDFIDTTQVTPGDWSISVYNNEMKNSNPLLVLGKYDRIPASIPVTTGVMRVVFKGKVPTLKLKYSAIEESKNCVFLSDSMNAFNVSGNHSSRDGLCSWIVPAGSGTFTILSPINLKVPAGKSLELTMFAEKGSSVQKFDGPLDRTFLPDMFLVSSSLYQLSINTSGSTPKDLHVMFERRSDYINSNVTMDSKAGNVKSVNYPGGYPFGYNQSYYIPGKGQALMTVQDMSLLTNHNFSVFSQATPNGEVFIRNDLSDVYDQILPLPILLTFSTQVDFPEMVKNMAERAHGFDVDFIHASVADNIDVSKNSSWEFKAGNASFVESIAVWTVLFNDTVKNTISDNILKINATFADDPSNTKATLKVYDSKSLRKDYAHEAIFYVNSTAKEKQFVTTTRIAFIVYNFTDAISSKKNFDVTFTVAHEKCSHSRNYTLPKCIHTDRCITDWMICNGIDDCGDWSDELYCGGKTPPTPPGPAPSGGGVSVIVAIFLLMPLGAILGIFGYVYLPHALLRLRNGRYSEFRDLSSVS